MNANTSSPTRIWHILLYLITKYYTRIIAAHASFVLHAYASLEIRSDGQITFEYYVVSNQKARKCWTCRWMLKMYLKRIHQARQPNWNRSPIRLREKKASLVSGWWEIDCHRGEITNLDKFAYVRNGRERERERERKLKCYTATNSNFIVMKKCVTNFEQMYVILWYSNISVSHWRSWNGICFMYAWWKSRRLFFFSFDSLFEFRKRWTALLPNIYCMFWHEKRVFHADMRLRKKNCGPRMCLTV